MDKEQEAAISEWERMLKENQDKPDALGLELKADGEFRTFIALYLHAGANDPELWQQIKEEAARYVANHTKNPHARVALRVNMPCGNTADFETLADIRNLPIQDVPCPCGDPNHWLVKFVVSNGH